MRFYPRNNTCRFKTFLIVSPSMLLALLALAVWGSPAKAFAQNQAPAPETVPGAAPPASPAQPKPAVELPEGDGKAIATEFCQDCHKLTNLTKARKTSDDWHDTVQTMMDRGARLPSDKVDTLIAYLVKNFGPDAPTPAAGTPAAAAPSAGSPAAAAAQPPKPVELPDGDGKAIAMEFCQDCHKLSNLTKARKAPDDWHDTVETMMDRGARLPPDKIDILVAYLAKNFGPKADSPSSGNASPDAAPAPASPSSH